MLLSLYFPVFKIVDDKKKAKWFTMQFEQFYDLMMDVLDFLKLMLLRLIIMTTSKNKRGEECT